MTDCSNDIRKAQNKENWGRILLDWQKSGKSQREYCLENKLAYWSFRDWKKKLLGSKAGVSNVENCPATFIPIELPTPAQETETQVEIISAYGLKIRARLTIKNLVRLVKEVGG